MSYHPTDAFGRIRREGVGGARGPVALLLDRLRARFAPAAARGRIAAARDPVELARAIGTARRQRGELLDNDLFAEPAWDLLLELYVATREGAEVAVSSASMAVGVPVSVSLRWIKELETRGLVVRRPTDEDHRRDLLELSQKGLQKMDTLLRTMLIR